MRPRTLAAKTKPAAAILLCLHLLLSLAPAQTSPPQQPAAERAVTVTLTAVDKEGKFVTALAPEDLRVEEDGAVRAVKGLERRADVPLLLSIGIDNSMSQERVIEGMKLAADVLVKSIMRPGTDRAAVFSFNSDATLEQGMTADASKVLAAVSGIRVIGPPGYVAGILVGGGDPKAARSGSTALYDAVVAVADDMASSPPGTGRRALILITDGVDTSSRVKQDEAVKTAVRAGAAIYPIGIGDSDAYNDVDRGALRKLAERTGGRAFFPRKVGDLPQVFAQLREELMSQYALTFMSPKRGGAFHKLKIKVVGTDARRRGVEVSFPQGYFE